MPGPDWLTGSLLSDVGHEKRIPARQSLRKIKADFEPALRWRGASGSAGSVGLLMNEAAWEPAVFTKNRDRLRTTEVSRKHLVAILAHDKVLSLLSDAYFSVDFTLGEAGASF